MLNPMPPLAWLALYCLLILAASLLGGWLPAVVRVTHQRLQLLGSVIAGFILGTALLHMLPHAAPDLPPLALGAWTLAGLLAMFLLERFFTFHHHELAEPHTDPDHQHTHACDHPQPQPSPHHHPQADREQHDPPDDAGPSPSTSHTEHQTSPGLSWTGVAVGLTVHSLLAGLALAAAISNQAHALVPGLAVFLIIAVHKPLDALTLIGLMRHGRASRPAMLAANAAFALVVPLGALAFYALAALTPASAHALAAPALAFAAGLFLCIALSDLLPELHFHAHDRGKLSAALLLGVALATDVSLAEHATHDHSHHDHDHEHHDQHDHDHDH